MPTSFDSRPTLRFPTPSKVSSLPRPQQKTEPLKVMIFGDDAQMTQRELDRMRPHTILGEKILARIDFLRPAAQIVRHHHEWFDGSGHPDGLCGDRIPLGARMFAIIDALDALTTIGHTAQVNLLNWRSKRYYTARERISTRS
jgi:hypothetical protein